MLVRLFYVSTAVGPQTTTVTGSILEHASRHNKANNIGGVLGQGKGLYLQVIEGPRGGVNSLYQSISKDSRHNKLELLSYEYIEQRKYPNWSMSLIDLSKDDPMVAMKHTDFDPYSANDVAMTQNWIDLMASKISI